MVNEVDLLINSTYPSNPRRGRESTEIFLEFARWKPKNHQAAFFPPARNITARPTGLVYQIKFSGICHEVPE